MAPAPGDSTSIDPKVQVRASYNRIAEVYLASRRRDPPDVVLRPRGLALLCRGAVDLPAWTEQYHDVPMYWSHYDAATSLALVKAAGREIVWDRWVADGAVGHLFVLAQRRHVGSALSAGPRGMS